MPGRRGNRPIPAAANQVNATASNIDERSAIITEKILDFFNALEGDGYSFSMNLPFLGVQTVIMKKVNPKPEPE